MWVFVSERLSDGFVGILDNQPGSFPPSDNVYLTLGAEIPFGPEHVVDIAEPPADYIETMRAATPSRLWPRQ